MGTHNKALVCARCMTPIKAEEPREKIGRFTYCEICAMLKKEKP